jgi:hypothetical protein
MWEAENIFESERIQKYGTAGIKWTAEIMWDCGNNVRLQK